ncbi:unnamed protein product [Laminaria digitata]
MSQVGLDRQSKTRGGSVAVTGRRARTGRPSYGRCTGWYRAVTGINTRFTPTMVIRRAGGVLQQQGAEQERGVRYMDGARAVNGPSTECPFCTDDTVVTRWAGGLQHSAP